MHFVMRYAAKAPRCGSLIALCLLLCLTASAKDDGCPFCGQNILKDTASVDNIVSMLSENHTDKFRCVLCAIATAKATKGDIVIKAPSEAKGKWVTITRTNGAWSQEPASASFAYCPGEHAHCEVLYRAMSSEDGFTAFRHANPKLCKSAKLFSLAELIARAE